MEIYQPPKSDLGTDYKRKYQPLTGLVLGLLVCIFVMFIASALMIVVFSLIAGISLMAPESEGVLENNYMYLATDIIVSALITFYAGKVVGERTPRKEIVFGFLLATLTLGFYVVLILLFESDSLYPAWYDPVSLTTMFVATILGARTKVKK